MEQCSSQSSILEKEVYKDVEILVYRLNSADNKYKKVFSVFGEFLQKKIIKKEHSKWLMSLKIDDYFENYQKIDDFLKKEYLEYIFSLDSLITFEKEEHIKILDFNHFSTAKIYRFYFIKYHMWVFGFENYQRDLNIKHENLPPFIQQIPGSIVPTYFFHMGRKISKSLGEFYGK